MSTDNATAILRNARAMRQARASGGDDPYRRGTDLLKAGYVSAALEAFREATAAMPTAPWPLVGVGDALSRLEDRPAAVEAYHKALALVPPGAVALLLNLAGCFEAVASYEVAGELCERVIAVVRNPSARLAGDGDAAKALRRAESGLARSRALQGRALLDEAASMLADQMLDPGDEPTIQIVLDLAPRHPALYRRYAETLVHAGQRDRAVAVLQLALAHDPSDGEAALILAELFLGNDPASVTASMVETIVGLLDRAVEFSATQAGDDGSANGTASARHIELVVRRARLLDLERPSRRCVEEWRTVLRADPERPLWHKELGDRLAELGEFEDAGVCYDRAVELGYEPF